MDAMIQHWITVLVAEESGHGGFGGVMHSIGKKFYVNDGLLTSTLPEWLQGVFNILMDIFGRVRLQNKCQ